MACPVDSLEVAGPGGGFRWPGRGTGHPGGHGAVDCQGGAGDEGGLVGAEPGRGGAGLRRPADSAISLVAAKAPPPPPSTAPPAPPPTAPPRDCHPSYPDVCLRPDASDYDGEGGSGNGPYDVSGPLRVLPPDPFELDGSDNDGWGCESG